MAYKNSHNVTDQRSSMECDGLLIDDQKCEVKYIISGRNVTTKEIYVRAEQNSTCPPQVDIFPIVFSVLGVILLIGIGTLLLWKVLTHIHDKKEFMRFENQRAAEIWTTTVCL